MEILKKFLQIEILREVTNQSKRICLESSDSSSSSSSEEIDSSSSDEDEACSRVKLHMELNKKQPIPKIKDYLKVADSYTPDQVLSGHTLRAA